MRTIRLDIQYDGTGYVGWQAQSNGPSIQAEVEHAVKKITSQSLSVLASGRTDAGVHARHQVCSFVLPNEQPEIKAFEAGLNSILPGDIRILRAQEVDSDFSALKSKSKKTYRYFLQVGADASVFLRNYSWQLKGPLDLEEMKKAASFLLGEHDFRGFMGPRTEVKTTVRKIQQAGFHSEVLNLLCFQISGNGFLRHMVRIIVGSLVEVGQGKREASSIPEILKSGDRKMAGQTAPPQGLFLWSVNYLP